MVEQSLFDIESIVQDVVYLYESQFEVCLQSYEFWAPLSASQNLHGSWGHTAFFLWKELAGCGTVLVV